MDIRIFSRESDSTFTNVRSSVRKQNPSTAWNHHLSSFNLHPSASFIILHSSFTFFIHPSFILRLLSFTACYLSFLYQNYKIYILPIQFLCNTFLHLILYILSCRFRGGKIIERAKNRKILNFNSILLLLCCRNDKNAIWFICIFHSIL